MPKVRKPRVRWMNGNILHVETPNGIVNVHVGLTDRLGRDVDAVEIIPTSYAGEARVVRHGNRLIRLKGK